VVTGGASAAYGSDAVAGGVNFVMNRRLEGTKAVVQAGETDKGDAKEYLIGYAHGSAFAGGKGHFIIGGELAKGLGAGTMFTRDWGRKQPGLVALPATRAAGLPAFLITNDAQSTIPPGSLITSCVQAGALKSGAACAVGGLTFDNSGNPVNFQFGNPVGTSTMVGGGNPGMIYTNKDILLRGGFDRKAAMASVNYEFSPAFALSADLSGGQFLNKTNNVAYVAASNFIVVNRDNPFIPAALGQKMDQNGVTQIKMSRTADDILLYPRNTNQFIEGRLKASGEIGRGWKYDAGLIRGVNDFWFKSYDYINIPNYVAALYAVKGPNGTPICGPMASNPMLANLNKDQVSIYPTTGCVPYNPFGPNVNPQATLDFVTYDMVQHTKQTLTTATFNVAGSPFSTWAGDASLALGYEHRKQEMVITVPPEFLAITSKSGLWLNNFLGSSGELSVDEVYAESGIPLLANSPLGQSLELNGAIRYANYSSTGGVTTWKVGLSYEPISSLRLRATASRDIRAPNILELYSPGQEGFAPQVNPATGVSSASRTRALNNPNLTPEVAKTLTAGVVFQPKSGMFDGLRLSVDYYKISIADAIASLTFPEILRRYYVLHDQSYAQYIEFDNSAIGFSRVSSPLLNLNSQTTHGVELEVAYPVPIESLGIPGKLTVQGFSTWTGDLTQFDSAGLSLGQRAGEVSGVPTWRTTVNLNYVLDRFSASLTTKYQSEVLYRYDLKDPTDAGYDPASSLSINNNRFPAVVYLNGGVNYKLGNDETGVTLYAIVDNILDKDPPVGTFGNVVTNNPYDVLGRAFRIGARFRY
jgi:hypothetical protein